MGFGLGSRRHPTSTSCGGFESRFEDLFILKYQFIAHGIPVRNWKSDNNFVVEFKPTLVHGPTQYAWATKNWKIFNKTLYLSSGEGFISKLESLRWRTTRTASLPTTCIAKLTHGRRVVYGTAPKRELRAPPRYLWQCRPHVRVGGGAFFVYLQLRGRTRQ